jgi:hypothetical protein
VRSAVLITGSLISLETRLDGSDAGADPAILERAEGVTWDVLDLCLAYGLDAQQAKKLLAARPPNVLRQNAHGDHERGRDSRGEQPIAGDALRDQFALQALHGIIDDCGLSADEVANRCYG